MGNFFYKPQKPTEENSIEEGSSETNNIEVDNTKNENIVVTVEETPTQ